MDQELGRVGEGLMGLGCAGLLGWLLQACENELKLGQKRTNPMGLGPRPNIKPN